MGECGSPVLDIVQQVIGDFKNALAHNVLMGSGLSGALASITGNCRMARSAPLGSY